MRLEALSPVGDQLELALDDVRVKIPWEGQSPRGLTEAGMSLFSRQEPQKSMSDLDWLACPRCGRPTKKGLRENSRGLLRLRRRDDHG